MVQYAYAIAPYVIAPYAVIHAKRFVGRNSDSVFRQITHRIFRHPITIHLAIYSKFFKLPCVEIPSSFPNGAIRSRYCTLRHCAVRGRNIFQIFQASVRRNTIIVPQWCNTLTLLHPTSLRRTRCFLCILILLRLKQGC